MTRCRTRSGAAGGTAVLKITLSEATVSALYKGDFKLYAFRAVGCDEGGGTPLVWGVTQTFATPSISLSWTEDYSAYTSTSAVPQQSSVVVGTDTVPAAFGDAFHVGPHAVLSPFPEGGVPDVITLWNTTPTALGGGLSLPSPIDGSTVVPVCAFPLYGNNVLSVGRAPHVLLTVAAQRFAAGAPVTRMYGPTMAVDISAAPTTDLAYDINAGWSSDSVDAFVVDPGEFARLLIVPTGAAERGRLPVGCGSTAPSASPCSGSAVRTRAVRTGAG